MSERGATSHGRLRSLVERIERLQEDRKAVVADLGEVFKEAKDSGFDVKILRKVIKRRATDKSKLAEEEALIELYESALEGRPASRREPPARDPEPDTPLERAIKESEPPQPETPPPTPDTVEVAAESGAQAARDGQPITANPYPAQTPQRLAWDEAWCGESGTDGMDIPDQWKPADKHSPEPKEERGDHA